MANQIRPSDLEQNPGATFDAAFNFKDKQVLTVSPSTSGDSPYEDRSSASRSRVGRTFSQSSPFNPNDIGLHNLTVKDDEPSFPGDGSSHYNHYSSPLQRGSDHSYGSPNSGYSQRDSGPHVKFPSGGRAPTGSQRKANTWMSPDVQAQQDYLTVRNSMRRLFKHSEVAKWKFNDYIAHREAMVASEAARLARQVKDKETSRNFSAPPIPLETQQALKKWGLEGNFDQVGNIGRALGEPTIWCQDWKNGKDDIAPWPSIAEQKWEGDDRAKTGVGRFLPLPREQGPHNIQWNQLPVIEQYPMDQVAKIPTMEDIYLPVDDQIEPEFEYLWSKELEKEIDEFLAL